MLHHSVYSWPFITKLTCYVYVSLFLDIVQNKVGRRLRICKPFVHCIRKYSGDINL